MNCNEIRELLAGYCDNEILDARIRALVEEHLRTCSACRTELNIQQEIQRLLRANANFLIKHPTPALKTRVLAEIRMKEEHPRGFNLRPAYALGMVAFLLAMFGVFIFLNYGQIGHRHTTATSVLRKLPESPAEIPGVYTAGGEMLVPTASEESFLEFVQNEHRLARELLLLESEWAKELEKLDKLMTAPEDESAEGLFKKLPQDEGQQTESPDSDEEAKKQSK